MQSAKEALNPCSLCSIRDVSCFSKLTSQDLKALEEGKSETTYPKNHYLFQEGSKPHGIFCIKKGKIKVYKIGFDGKEQIVQIAGEGDLLGYRALISGTKYPVSAKTLEEASFCVVGEKDFFELLNTSTELNNTLLKQACKELGQFTEKLTHQAQLTVRERFAIILHQLHDIYKTSTHEPEYPVEINLTREDLANLVGTATETLIRLVHDFKEEKVIDSKGRRIYILEPEKLAKIGHLKHK